VPPPFLKEATDMNPWTEYILAGTVEEAVSALAAGTNAQAVAGGTDLLLEIQQGRRAPIHTLVDVSRIPELNRLEQDGNHLIIGAGVPVACIVTHPLVLRHARAVSEACRLIGGPQVRNTATLGGNVAHALPAADGMIALVAIDAQVEIAGPQGRRAAPILSLFQGPGHNTLLPGEILVHFLLPLRGPGEGSAFARVMRPQGVALPILNMAVWLARKDNTVASARIAIGPAGPVPRRATEVEELLTGQSWSEALVSTALERLRATARFRSSPRRANADYRHHLGGVLLEDVLATAWQRTDEMEITL
jgi:carbon-monoxide dehydrogenase medium subunit